MNALAMLIIGLAMMVSALATGSPVLLTVALLLWLVLVGAFVSVQLAAHTLTVQATLQAACVQRGEKGLLVLTTHVGSPLPIAPIELQLEAAPGETLVLEKNNCTFDIPLPTRHIGEIIPDRGQVLLQDLFGLFTLRRRLKGCCTLLVLPADRGAEPLRFSAGDSGFETVARASQDISDPADVRGWQPGDPLKKVHWKLSARKNELMVRRFEEPQLPEALILPDCSAPPDWGSRELGLDIRDALAEKTTSVAAMLLRQKHPVRVPLSGEHPWCFDSGMELAALQQGMARLSFSCSDPFERVLQLEAQRMRHVGATVAVAARLNSAMVDMLVQLRRMGPYVTLYLIAPDPEDPRIAPLVSRLRQGDVEVEVSPVEQ